jgi:hypothetical protein
METLNKSNMKGLVTKVFTRVLASLGVVLALAACGSSSGNSTGALSGCVNCSSMTNAQAMFNFQSESWNGYSYNTNFPVTFTNMTMYGNNVSTTIAGFNGATTTVNADTYSGAIAVQGTFTVGQQISDASGICTIPAGTYTVTTYSQGQYSGGEFVVQVLINGNILATMGSSASPFIYGDNGYVAGELYINSVNNVTCGAFYTYMD